MNEDIINAMRGIEPGYSDWTDVQIKEQITAINECGYEWVQKDDRGGFRHKDSGVYLKVTGLNYYTPEMLKDTYRNLWSKDFDGVKARGHIEKILKGIPLFLLSLVVFVLFYDSRVAVITTTLFLLYVGYHYLKYRSHRKKSIRNKIERVR